MRYAGGLQHRSHRYGQEVPAVADGALRLSVSQDIFDEVTRAEIRVRVPYFPDVLRVGILLGSLLDPLPRMSLCCSRSFAPGLQAHGDADAETGTCFSAKVIPNRHNFREVRGQLSKCGRALILRQASVECCADLSDFVSATKSSQQPNRRAFWALVCHDYSSPSGRPVAPAPSVQRKLGRLPRLLQTRSLDEIWSRDFS